MNVIEERFHQCGLSYGELDSMLRRIVCKFLGYYQTEEMVDEFVSEGWMIVLEMIDKFDPNLGIKFSSFVWMRLQGHYNRHLRKLLSLSGEEPDETTESTEDWDECSVFELNPYCQTPERYLECVENLNLWKTLKKVHSDTIRSCMQQAPNASDNRIRKRFSRNRCVNIRLMKDTLDKIV